ncbi:hypothetical protein ACFQAT_10385 [Undibacterium arcticum]
MFCAARHSMRRGDYRDPLVILIERESRTCKGCAFAKVAWDRQFCSKGRSFGKRCKNYVEGDAMQTARNQESFVKLSPFDEVMNIWVRWVNLKDFQHSDGDGNLQDTKDFMRAGEAVEAMINDLPRHQWWAIRKSKGISTVWIFPHLSLLDTLEQAEKILTPKMQNHIATRRYFY